MVDITSNQGSMKLNVWRIVLLLDNMPLTSVDD